MRQIIAVISDMHVGSSVAISPMKYELSDGVMFKASDFQESILRFYAACWEEIWRVAGNDPIYTVINGDAVDGNHHGTYQLWTRSADVQAHAAVELLRVPSNRSEKVFVIRGTTAHVGEEGVSEDIIAKELGAHTKKALPDLPLTVQGVDFYFKHHGPNPGKLPHTRGDSVRRELRKQFTQSIENGHKPVQHYVWGHFHQKWYEPKTMRYLGDEYLTHGYTLPAWQLSTKYVDRIEKGQVFCDIGMIYFVIEDGVVTHKFLNDSRTMTEGVTI